MEHTQKNGKVWRSRLLRISLIVMASLMLLCGSYLVTYALLHNETETVTNTFKQTTAFADSLLIVEQIPVDGEGTDGVMNGILDETPSKEVTDATYYYAPGVTLNKRVYVKIENLKEDAYLFVTAATNGTAWKETGLAWNLDTNNWVQFTDDKGNTVYACKTKFLRGQSYNMDGKATNMDVILNDQVTVHQDIYSILSPDTTVSDLTFNAYLVQAMGLGSAEAAWNATYGKP